MSKYPPAIAKQLNQNQEKGSSTFQINSLWKRISEKTIVDFTRGLAVMVKANVSLVKALDISIQQTDNSRFKDILRQIQRNIKSGKSLAQSLAKHKDIFDGLYIHLVEVGELAGILDEILFRLSGYMEKRYSLKQKVRMAMVYPAIVVTVAASAILFLLLFIVPTFAEMYNDFNAELPKPTQFVLSMSQVISDYFLYVLILVIGIVLLIRHYLQKPQGQYMWDRLKLRIPFLGVVFQKTLMTRFCQTLGTMLKSGITLLDALTIIGKATENMVITKATNRLITSVRKGEGLAKSLQGVRVFPGMVVQMISVGEATSELDDVLLHIADLYDEEVDLAVESLTSIIEPVLIVILGIVLGSLIISMYLPIFELMNVIK